MIASVIIDILMYRNLKLSQDEQGVNIIAVSRNEESAQERFGEYWNSRFFNFVSRDITQPLPELGNIDYMLHAASNTHPRMYSTDPIGTITANVQGTYQLLEYASFHECQRFLFFSSVEIYGENRNDVEKFDEKYLGYIDCNTMRSGYPESKRLGETLCHAFVAQKGQNFVIGRFSRVYGPTMSVDDSKAIAQFIKKAAADEAGTKVIFELLDQVEQAGYSAATKAMLDATKMEGLGWKALTPIEEGLRKTVQMLRE